MNLFFCSKLAFIQQCLRYFIGNAELKCNNTSSNIVITDLKQKPPGPTTSRIAHQVDCRRRHRPSHVANASQTLRNRFANASHPPRTYRTHCHATHQHPPHASPICAHLRPSSLNRHSNTYVPALRAAITLPATLFIATPPKQ